MKTLKNLLADRIRLNQHVALAYADMDLALASNRQDEAQYFADLAYRLAEQRDQVVEDIDLLTLTEHLETPF